MAWKGAVPAKAVIYTEAGAKIVDCEMRVKRSCHDDHNEWNITGTKNYLLVGGSDAEHPELIEQAEKYARTKFFRLMIDLWRLAQFEPISFANRPLEESYWSANPHKSDINFSTRVEELDAQFYRKYGFTSAMIDFVERRYSYDDTRI